jgi:integrase
MLCERAVGCCRCDECRYRKWLEFAVRGVPMGVIAEQLGHVDTRMTEKHYAHLAVPILGISVDEAVMPLRRQKISLIRSLRRGAGLARRISPSSGCPARLRGGRGGGG